MSPGGVTRHRAALRFADGIEANIAVEVGEAVLGAAERQGRRLPSSCREGTCGSCVGIRRSGTVRVSDQAIALSPRERAEGRFLACQTTLESDAILEFDFESALCDSLQCESVSGRLASLEQLNPAAARLVIELGEAAPLTYRPGQYLDLRVPGTESWRSYSYANLPNEDNRIELLVRLLPHEAAGAMSDYLRDRAAVGDPIEVVPAGGAFYLRDLTRPVMLMAGGTGLSAILAILRQLVAQGCDHPVTLLYGASRSSELCLIDELEELGSVLPAFRMSAIAQHADTPWAGRLGVVTDLLEKVAPVEGGCDVYLCGPPGMVEATQAWFADRSLAQCRLHHEKFAPSARDGMIAVPPSRPQRPARGPETRAGKPHRHAVVVGGSIAGMLAARALSDDFAKVTVLERDTHHPMEMTAGRASTSQAQHAHHLLQGGQRVFTELFPDFVADFVAAGGKVVDSTRDFRFYQNSGWKVVFDGGTEVCVGRRSLIEGVLRRQLEKLPTIDYRYQAEAEDLLHQDGRVTGVRVREGAGTAYDVEADLVVDASGKNSSLLDLLAAHGYKRPRESQQQLRVWYSTMLFTVPQHLRDQDWTITAIYNRRPQEDIAGYAARYGHDGATLLVTLIQFDCDNPLRDAAAFRQAAKRLAQPHIHELIEQCEPLTEPATFRYPAMVRRHFEAPGRRPAGFIAIGDALASPDPVSGAGMTKSALEAEQLRKTLTRHRSSLDGLAADYFRRVSRLTGDIWFVLSEQNYRFPWVEGKRPFGTPVINWYVDQVLDLGHYDPVAVARFMDVYHLNRPYTSLFAPGMVMRVLRHTVFHSRRHVHRPAAPDEIRQPKVLPRTK